MPAPRPAAALIERVRAAFQSFPDMRQKSNNQQYEILDAALSAFSVFFTQSPSFLDYQIRMQKQLGQNNANSLFGVHKIPRDNTIRNLLDPVPPATLYPVFTEIGDELFYQGCLNGYRSINNTFLIALDGTDFASSENISCPNCTKSVLKNGKILYRHICVTPVIVAPGKENVIVLPPEFVHPQDGAAKQDCELAASRRWLARWGSHYRPLGVTYLGDDLYCHQPFCQQLIAQKEHFLFTCKPESHATLYEWVADLERIGKITTVVVARRIGRKHFTDTYSYINQLPLRNSDDALMVNWCKLVTTNADGVITYSNAWATSHLITDRNVAELVTAGRARWKIENENNNTLKTKGYNLEHNFGHGGETLANLLATMNLLAFLMHTTLGMLDKVYAKVRDLLPSRRTFFEHFRALTQYLLFDSWDHLLNFMLQGLSQSAPNTS